MSPTPFNVPTLGVSPVVPILTLHAEREGRAGDTEVAPCLALVFTLILLGGFPEFQPQRVGRRGHSDALPEGVTSSGGAGGHRVSPPEQGELGGGVAVHGTEQDGGRALAALQEGLQPQVPGGVCGAGMGWRAG